MILLLSGPIAVGKSSFADRMINNYGFQKISSSNFLKRCLEKAEVPLSREALQQLGDRLDIETNFTWLVEDVVKPKLAEDTAQNFWLIDAVRKPEQVAIFKHSFEDVFHVHLTADEQILKSRYSNRLQTGQGAEGVTTYEKAIEHPNEIVSRSLSQFADLIVDTGHLTASVAGDIAWGKICKGA
jgi:adenylate kinase family enzyme